MRIIPGEKKEKKIEMPTGYDIRPTTEKVKEAMFNIIQFDVEGRRALDLFAGTGQLGIEALSRGARECVFVDVSRDSLKLVRENLRRCGLDAPVIQCDAESFLRRGERFDLIFMDPPYGMGLESAALEAVKAFDILSVGGIMVCETGRETELPDLGPDYERRVYRYGKIKLTVFTRGD